MKSSTYHKQQIRVLKQIPVDSNDITVLLFAEDFRIKLLECICNAKQRIYLSALYIQDDEVGKQVMEALYEAKQKNPNLDIKVFVDFHRAQRTLIGQKGKGGNNLMYCSMKEKYPIPIEIYGVPIKTREVFGVLHLKGFVFDNEVLYSGASINNVYLHKKDLYRYDRYFFIKNRQLADCMVNFLRRYFVNNSAPQFLDKRQVLSVKELKLTIQRFVKELREAQYHYDNEFLKKGQVGVTPISGFGKHKNLLNKTIHHLIRSTTKQLILLTPYFNLPKQIVKDIDLILKEGVKVTLVAGDKTANDFFIPTDQPFRKIGALPYIYEQYLREFIKDHQDAIDKKLLTIRLWKNDNNTYHLKGIYSDNCYRMITGHNINPRAWSLDFENGLLIRDPGNLLKLKIDRELEEILKNTYEVKSYQEIQTTKEYPKEVQHFLANLEKVKAGFLIKRVT